jgi:hydrogenase 3 maturation protease
MDRILGKVVLAGLGCPDRGDDGAGCALARSLQGHPSLRALDCGDRPENYTGDIAREEPDTVLLADALEMGGHPGDVAILEAEELGGGGFETHRASVGILMEYLRRRTGARVLLLGIQPSQISDGEGLSPEVAASVANLARLLGEAGTLQGVDHVR